MAQIERVAASETRVCILGETGTGKELVARAIHEKSPRRDGPFVTLNCAAVPAELIESELFGHEKGSFTGAAARHIGKFEQADGGTLFLDEIGDMPLAMQAKLLRVLEEGEVERVGGDKPMRVNVRVVVATHRNLEDVGEGKWIFRQDLFHRDLCFSVGSAAVARADGGFAGAGEALSRRQVAAQNGWKEKPFDPRRDRRAAAVRVAGKCARAAQRRGAADAAVAGNERDRGGSEGSLARFQRTIDAHGGRIRRPRPPARWRSEQKYLSEKHCYWLKFAGIIFI